MNDVRKPRVQDNEPPRSESREHASRVDELADERATHRPERFAPWVRPSSLAAPDPRPGFVQRWIRVSMKGEEDPRNVNMRTREGWSPRPISSVPDDFFFMASKTHEKGGHFVVDDLMLCEMPRETYEQRAAYYRNMADRQMNSVEEDLDRVQVEGAPIHRSRKSTVSYPTRPIVGRSVEAADD